MANNTDWTEDGIMLLRALWADGHPAAEIGRRLCISKNAIIGKAHRLDLPPRPSPIHAKGSGKPHRPLIPQPRGLDLPSPGATAANVPTPRVLPPAPVKPAAPTFVRPTTRLSCCWPVGEPRTSSFRYCDAAAELGKSYCPEHAGLAYVAARRARGRPDGPILDRYLDRELRRTT